MGRLGLQVVGRVVAVVLAARELARRPVARAKPYGVAVARARLAGRRSFGARGFGAGLCIVTRSGESVPMVSASFVFQGWLGCFLFSTAF